MNDAHIERLLEQMKLAAPSATLDDRVIACCQETLPQRDAQRNRSGVIAVTLSVVASLIVVVAIGRWSNRSMNGSENNAMKPTATGRQDSQIAMVPGPGEVLPGHQTDNMHPVRKLSREPVLAFFRGPTTGQFCSLTDSAQTAADNRGCLRCHQGGADLRRTFLQQHATQLHAETCAICHRAAVPVNEDPQATSEHPSAGEADCFGCDPGRNSGRRHPGVSVATSCQHCHLANHPRGRRVPTVGATLSWRWSAMLSDSYLLAVTR
jgi:hypothetical protein